MKKIILSLSACLLVASCSTTPPAPTGPEKIGKAPSQPGNCYYRGLDGKVFISPC